MAVSESPAEMSLWTDCSIRLGTPAVEGVGLVEGPGMKAGAVGDRLDEDASALMASARGMGNGSLILWDLVERESEGDEGRLAGGDWDREDTGSDISASDIAMIWSCM